MAGGEVCPLPRFPREAQAAAWGILARRVNHHMEVLTLLRSLLPSQVKDGEESPGTPPWTVALTLQ